MPSIHKLVNLLNDEKVNNLINLLVVSPLLYLIQYDWSKFAIVALILAVFIVVKNILLLVVNYTVNGIKKIKATRVLLKLVQSAVYGTIFYLQYKFQEYTKYNKILSAILAVYSVFNLFGNKHYNIVSHHNTVSCSHSLENTTHKTCTNDKSDAHKRHMTKEEVDYFLRNYKIN